VWDVSGVQRRTDEYFTVLEILSQIKLTRSAFVSNKQSIDLKMYGSTVKIKLLKTVFLPKNYVAANSEDHFLILRPTKTS
jgi:hypothetical protein